MPNEESKNQTYFKDISGILKPGLANTDTQDPKLKTWDGFVIDQIKNLVSKYKTQGGNRNSVETILERWHRQITIDYKHDTHFSPHINGFYMIFMVHGTWYDQYKRYVSSENSAGLSNPIPASEKSLNLEGPYSYFNMMATDIDVPDLTEEYISVSSRIRNSFMPSRNYFVSDFSISYIENINLDIMRYHEAWQKYMNLVKRGEVKTFNSDECERSNNGYFMEVPYANAVWVAVFKPFTTDIQLLIKLIGVMPQTLPLKQLVGNRSQSKMTVLNISYKAADLFFKFYKNTEEMLNDDGKLAKSFKREVMKIEN